MVSGVVSEKKRVNVSVDLPLLFDSEGICDANLGLKRPAMCAKIEHLVSVVFTRGHGNRHTHPHARPSFMRRKFRRSERLATLQESRKFKTGITCPASRGGDVVL